MGTLTILGIGRAGGALAIAFNGAGVTVDQLIVRDGRKVLPGVDAPQCRLGEVDSISSDVLIIATPDPDIAKVGKLVAKMNGLPKVALHLSGSLSSSELTPLKEKGVAVGSMHPLVSISDPVLGATRFSGVFFCVEGDAAAIEAAIGLVQMLSGRSFTIDTRFKPLYHASAVMASGNVTALFDAAVEMLSACGVAPNEAHGILFPLLESAVANLSSQSTEDALTGPFVRGDLGALERHLDAFDGTVSDKLRQIYLVLAERSVEIATRSDRDNTDTLADAISVAKRKTGC